MDFYLEKVPLKEGELCTMRELQVPFMSYPLHYHPEYELIFVERGHGERLVGDHIGNFEDGDLVLVGTNLPHRWQNDRIYKEGKRTTHAYVVHFRLEYLETFLKMEGHENIQQLLSVSAQGLWFPSEQLQGIEVVFQQLAQPSSLEKTMHFLTLLQKLAVMPEKKSLASSGYSADLTPLKMEGINRVMQYIMDNYQDKVELSKAAALLSMSKPAFCHYFKKKTNKSFSGFVNELRIGKACRELIGSDKRVTEICFDNGFQNLAYFNRKFRTLKGLSPTAYRKKISGLRTA